MVVYAWRKNGLFMPKLSSINVRRGWKWIVYVENGPLEKRSGFFCRYGQIPVEKKGCICAEIGSFVSKMDRLRRTWGRLRRKKVICVENGSIRLEAGWLYRKKRSFTSRKESFVSNVGRYIETGWLCRRKISYCSSHSTQRYIGSLQKSPSSQSSSQLPVVSTTLRP